MFKLECAVRWNAPSSRKAMLPLSLGIACLFQLVSPFVYCDVPSPQLGTPLSQSTINEFSITVFPDGSNLPHGEGDVKQGEKLYRTLCMMCHGEKGIEGPAARLAGSDGWFSLQDPLRILRIRKYPILLISVGSMWPYATSIFDYTRRAMPHNAPKSLTDNEVYSLTAYILYLNDIIKEDTTINEQNIATITMPGKARSISNW